MAVTIYDVAREAGVGISTVSRVLNETTNVSEETRDRVLGAIKALGYTPNPAARNLSRPTVRTVGVLMSYLTNPFQVAVLQGIERSLSEAGIDLIIYNIDSHERRESLLESMTQSRRFDGLIAISFLLSEKLISRLERYNIPLVIGDHRSDRLPSVYIDNVEGGWMATRHLIKLGHRRIGYIQDYSINPNGPGGNHPGHDRYLGYCRALEEAGIDFDPDLVAIAEGHTRPRGMEAAGKLLTLTSPPSAIFAVSDMMALGVIEHARSAGVRIPQDLALVGYDDIELASFVQLSTIRQPMERLGEVVGHVAATLVAGEPLHERSIQLPLELVVRNSSGQPVSH